MPIWKRVGGVNAAVDVVYEVYLNGKRVDAIVASPGLEVELALGYLAYKCFSREAIRRARVRVEDSRLWVEVDESESGKGCRRVESRVKVGVDEVKFVVSLLVEVTKVVKKYGGALHSGVGFSVPLDSRPVVVLHDVSRHSLVEKMVGAIIRFGKNARVVAITGRVDAGMVDACSVAGVEVIAVWRSPVLSGILRAEELGITIVYVRNGMVKVLTHPERIAV